MDRIISEIKNTADKVVKKSGELVEITKVKLSIVDIKNKIDARFKELGRIVYNASGPEYSEAEGADAIIEELNALYEELKKTEERLAELKSEVVCKSCGSLSSDDSLYCRKCGAKLD